MALEIKNNNGCGVNKDHVLLKLDHLGPKIIDDLLPGIRELSMTFANVDPIKNPIPVVPTCHYMMGGIPTNKYGQVINIYSSGEEKIVNGLYAVGECACVSVHGANRLGGNSLLDLVVFGRASGDHLISLFNEGFSENLVSKDDIDVPVNRFNVLFNRKIGENVSDIKNELKVIMQNDFGVFRSGSYMKDGLNKLKDLRKRLAYIYVNDKNKIYNTAIIEAFELENLVLIALTTAIAANERQESRGAHYREDFPDRDDKNWIKHSLIYRDDAIKYRSVNMSPKFVDKFLPITRTY
jgi:succinate dehydrogenase / fumarate reductase flavoprotein subunit